ncbi:MAG: CocE/NonD family hydrolase, partial [Gemmatimonadaceae bacterium]|nr:CocE/NonD family hydrolase [Gemmatimonadaceae bacterium]
MLLAVLSAMPVEGRQVVPGVRVYDMYETGIHTGELVLSEGRWQKTLTLKRRDRLSGKWSAPVSVSLDRLSTSQDLRLAGALRVLPSIISQVEEGDWGAHPQVTIATKQGALRQYVRHRRLTESAGGKKTVAFYWALTDGGLLKDRVTALDLIIGAGNELIAGIDPSGDNSIVLRGYEMFTSQKLWSNPKISPAKYGYRKLKEMVRMSDGVRLATHVYLPDGGQAGERYPAILIRSPYTFIPAEMVEKMPLPDDLWGFVARGYALVHQDVRGSGHSEGDSLSEGKWLPWVHELKDGDETLTWVASQPWCDGNVGMSGISYMGMTQWAAAHRGNPALKAMVPVSALGTPFNDMPFTGGAITAPSEWVFHMSGAPTDKKYDWKKIWKHRPLIDMDLAGMGRESALWNLFMTRPNHDDFWKAADWLRHEQHIAQPALQISGWYDEDLPATLANWEMMQRNQRAHRRLILGAWRHYPNRDRMINGVSFGVDAIRNDLKVTVEKWYDRFLKGIDNGVEDGPAVEYF